jgi:hypothetical protein
MSDPQLVIPAQAGTQTSTGDAALRRFLTRGWAPAYAGVTVE